MLNFERELIIMHGFPGSGKTTQSNMICSEYPEIGHVSIGEVWRGVMNNEIKSQYHDQVTSQDITEKQSDHLTNNLLFEAIDNIESSKKVILIDGYPRFETAIEPFFLITKNQRCRILGGICLELSMEQSISRIGGRGIRLGEKAYKDKGISDEDKYWSFHRDTFLKTIPALRQIISLPSVDASRKVDEVYVDIEKEIYNLRRS